MDTGVLKERDCVYRHGGDNVGRPHQTTRCHNNLYRGQNQVACYVDVVVG